MKNKFSDAMNFRHACKVFDESKKINDEEIRYILEAGVKSPSSFGMEGWKFLVITDEALKARLRPSCWNQVQITSCSHLVVVLANIASLKPENGEVRKRFMRRDMPEEKLEFYLDLYAKHLSDTLSSDEKIYAWSARQTYIAAANMMSAAAYIGIDSCPIEGFVKNEVEEILKLDTKQHQVAMLLPLGYRLNEQSKQIRLPFDSIIEFI